MTSTINRVLDQNWKLYREYFIEKQAAAVSLYQSSSCLDRGCFQCYLNELIQHITSPDQVSEPWLTFRLVIAMKSFLYEQILTIDFWKGFLQVLYKQLIFDNRCFLVSGIDLILINVKIRNTNLTTHFYGRLLIVCYCWWWFHIALHCIVLFIGASLFFQNCIDYRSCINIANLICKMEK